jgi:hypothetical protein
MDSMLEMRQGSEHRGSEKPVGIQQFPIVILSEAKDLCVHFAGAPTSVLLARPVKHVLHELGSRPTAQIILPPTPFKARPVANSHRRTQ